MAVNCAAWVEKFGRFCVSVYNTHQVGSHYDIIYCPEYTPSHANAGRRAVVFCCLTEFIIILTTRNRMRVSKLFGRTSKTEGVEYKSASHRLLTQAGFIRESAAGRYFMLPLGLKVHDRIQDVVRKHMDAAGAQE